MSGQLVDEDVTITAQEAICCQEDWAYFGSASGKRRMAMRAHHEVAESDAVRFLALHKSEWTDQRAGAATRTLNRCQFSKANNLPTTDTKKPTSHLAEDNIRILDKYSAGSNTVQYYHKLQ